MSSLLQQQRIEQLIKIQKEALELFKRKNADYGDAFAECSSIGVLVRIQDKLTFTFPWRVI